MVRLVEFRDSCYGFKVFYPEGWDFVLTGLPNLFLFSSSDRRLGVFAYSLSEDELKGGFERVLVSLGREIFGSDSVVVEDVSFRCVGTRCFYNGFYSDPGDPVRFGFRVLLEFVIHDFEGFVFKEPVAFGLVFEEGFEGDVLSFLLDRFESLFVKDPSPMGFNVPVGVFRGAFEVGDSSFGKWEFIGPVTWSVFSLGDGFVADAGCGVVGVRPFFYPLGGESIDRGVVEVDLSVVLEDLGFGSFSLVDFRCEGGKCICYGSVGEEDLVVYAVVSLLNFVNSGGVDERYLVLRFAVYPKWVEVHFLPIAAFSLSSWRPLDYFLYEVLGFKYPVEVSFSDSSDTSFEDRGVIDSIGRKSQSFGKRQINSQMFKKVDRFKIFREKLRGDLKRIIDWEKNLWESTYQTLKLSDTITSMYNLKDKYGRIRIVSTNGLASPSTHTFWKHKDDVAWRSTLATRKPFKPILKHKWEKLKWRWDEDLKKLKRDVDKKKGDIDKLFSS